MSSRLEDSRVAVISCSLIPEENELWQAAAKGVQDLLVIGAKTGPSTPHVEDSAALTELMSGKGLVWRHLVGLQAELRRFRPDLVHVNGELWSVTVQEVITRQPTVVVHGAENLWTHGGAVERRLRDRLVDRAVRRIAGYASWNQAGADHVRKVRVRLRGSPLPTAVLPAIVPPEPFRASTWTGSGGSASPLEILLVGRAVPEKGFATVIEAARITGRPVNVTLCGEGSEEGALNRIAGERGVSFRAKGWIDAEELPSLMAASHVLVQPSQDVSHWSEQFGRTVAEAMAVGLPVVVSDAGALPEVVGHQEAAIFKQGDAAALAERLSPLFGADGGLGTLAEQQHKRAEMYLPDRAAHEVLELWRRAL